MKDFMLAIVSRLGAIALLAMIAGVAPAMAATPAASPSSATSSSTGKTMQTPSDKATSPAVTPGTAIRKKIGIVLFADFETLDVFGPVEMWGRLPDYEIVMISQDGKPVKSAQGIETVVAYSFADVPQVDILMVPGGTGTRAEVSNPAMLAFLQKQDRGTSWTTSVCTGSALLAKAGILDGRKATSNKLAFKWVSQQSDKVAWQGHARWVIDGKYVTSSGVSAGTDMALGLVEKLYGRDVADKTAHFTEYVWDDDPNKDPFAVEAKP